MRFLWDKQPHTSAEAANVAAPKKPATIITMTLRQIDSLCDDFEAALRRGDTTLIENFLPQVEETKRTALLKELLEVEIQFAAERCPTESAEFLRSTQKSLERRFPDQHNLIQALFRQIVPLRQIGDYEILGELGRGGMGIVYKAKHKLLQQTVAVKVLSQALLDDVQAVGRFRREMQLIGSLVHPNIVRALNAGETEGMHYLAMEFVDGISLQKLVETVREKNVAAPTLPIISLGAACEAVRQAALGLQHAHEFRLVHRDIKPANLMLDHRGTVKVLDLGLGKFAEECRSEYHSSLTMEGMVVGTVDYISPEQCENSREADIRSDLYSLAGSLYFLLTGKPVYSGSRYDTMRKKLMAHIVGDVPSIRQVIPQLPVKIEAVLQKALAKEPAERFQTPIEFAEALAPFASFDELWTLVGEEIPAGGSGVRSDSWHSNTPHTFVQSARQSIAPPVSRFKMILLFVGLNILIALGIAAAFIFYAAPSPTTILTAMRLDADATVRDAEKLRAEWKMAEAHDEYQKALRKMAAIVLKTEDVNDMETRLRNRIALANTLWCLGDARTAGRELDTVVSNINDMKLDEQSKSKLDYIRKTALERRGDIGLFGGAASGITAEQFNNRIARYNDAVRIRGTPKPSPDDHKGLAVHDNNENRWNNNIRWKQAILWALHGNLEEAERLLEENPLLKPLVPDEREFYDTSIRELAEAVVFYYQRAGDDVAAADRDDKLRTFQRQFTLRSNALGGEAMRPEILELLLFSSEFLIHDSIRNEDWKILSEDYVSITNMTGGFLRLHPGATPFLRRFYELLVWSAVLLHNNSAQPREQIRHIDNVVRLLEQMRLPVSDAAEREQPTWIYFFLPETNRPEEGFVIFYPQDAWTGTLYPLPLTRQMLKQPDGRGLPPLPPQLLEQVAAEQSSGRRLRISWEDTAAWFRADAALTEKEYPYGDVLPLNIVRR